MSRVQQIAKLRQELLRDKPDLANQVRAIRENAVANLPDLIQMATETLQQKLAKVYFARGSADVADILKDLLKDETRVSRAHSNTLDEVDFDGIMANMGIEVSLTKLEEIVRQQMELPAIGHPHLLVMDQPRQVIEEGLQRFIGHPEEIAPDELGLLVTEQIKQDILRSEYGVTGADCIVAENGVLALAEDEGNLRAVSNLPYKHVAIVGLEEIVATAEEAVTVIQAASIFGAGRISPTYVSLIAGPSRTADIEFRMAYGMHGPKEVHVILLDNGRTALRDEDGGALLKCINCGSCYESCRELAAQQQWTGATMTPKGFALGLMQGRLCPTRLKASMREFCCPVGLSAETVPDKLSKI
jgi:L-lactate utilization protein LutB